MSELVVLDQLEQFKVDYKPSEISIENEEAFAAMVETTAAQYESFVYGDDNVAEAKKDVAKLRKIAKRINDERLTVSRAYKEPLTVFEATMNKYKGRLEEVANNINVNVSAYENEQKLIRQSKINVLIDEMLESHNLDIDDLAKLEIPSSWTTAGAFTKKGEPTKKIVEEVHGKLGYIALEKQRIAEAKNAVKDFATLSGLDPYAWENLIDQGLTSAEVIERIKQAVEQKKADEAEKERQRIAKEEYDAAMEELRKRSQEQVGNTVIDGSTGEIVTHIEQKETDEVMTFTLNITGPKSKLYELNRYMTEQGLTFQKI